MVSSLQTKGWCLNEKALELELDLAEESDRLKDVKKLEEFLLDTDLKEVGTPVLYDKFDRKKGEVACPLILQLTKWRNLNYPSVGNHEKNVGVCTMTLSDGHSSVRTFSIDTISKIDGNTPFGSKILLTGKVRSENGLLLLNNKNTILLGGNVEKLVEKWKTEKYSGTERKVTSAPKWIPFSKAKNLNVKFDKTFSALKNANAGDDKEVDEKTAQFIAERQAKIEELDVPVPKPVQDLDTQFKATSLNDNPPSRNNQQTYNKDSKRLPERSNEQYSRGNQRGNRGGSRPQYSQDDNRQQKPQRDFNNEQYSSQSRGNQSNEYSRGGQSRGNDNLQQRPQRDFKNAQYSSQSKVNNDRQFEKNEYSRGGRSRGQSRGNQSNEYSRGNQSNEYSRGQARGNDNRQRPQRQAESQNFQQSDNRQQSQSRGNFNGPRNNDSAPRGRGNRGRATQSRGNQNSYNDYQPPPRTIQLDISDFPQLGL